MNLSDILTLKYPDINLITDVVLKDKGDGAFIAAWYYNDSWPTTQELSQWAIDYDLAYRQKVAVSQRAYPSWQEQMDMQYHDAQDGTTTWIDCITAIKAAHPKPLA